MIQMADAASGSSSETTVFFAIVPERRCDEYWQDKLIWSGWVPLSRHPSLFASAEIAEQEAKSDYPWASNPPFVD
jgi:hypothetical protein